MIRRLAGMAVLIVTVLLVQTTVLPVLLRPGFLPDLAAVLALLVTLELGPRAGLWTAAAGGLLSDLLSSAPLGGGIAVAATVAGLVGLLRPYLGERVDLAAVPLSGLGAAVAFLLAGAVRAILTAEPALAPRMVGGGAVATALLGAVAAVPLLPLLRRALGPDPASGASGGVA